MSLFARSLPITLASMLLAVVFLSGCNSSASNRLQTSRYRFGWPIIGGQVVEIPLRFSGIVRAAQRATLTFQVSGTLKERPVELGQTVKAGDVSPVCITRPWNRQGILLRPGWMN